VTGEMKKTIVIFPSLPSLLHLPFPAFTAHLYSSTFAPMPLTEWRL